MLELRGDSTIHRQDKDTVPSRTSFDLPTVCLSHTKSGTRCDARRPSGLVFLGLAVSVSHYLVISMAAPGGFVPYRKRVKIS